MTRRAKQVSKLTKGNKKEHVERQRDERRQKNIARKDRRNNKEIYCSDDGDFVSFRRQMEMQGYKIKDVMGDGNCLFRALADQFNGDDKMHGKHRKEVVQYMKENKDDFAPFLDESVTFEKYLENLSSSGTYGRNDSIVAFARLHTLDIIIHQLNSPTFCINGKNDDDLTQKNNERKIVLHLAYHSMEHYSSIRRSSDPGSGSGYLYHENTYKKSLIVEDTGGTTPEEKQTKKQLRKLKKVSNDIHKQKFDETVEGEAPAQNKDESCKLNEKNLFEVDANLSSSLQLISLQETEQLHTSSKIEQIDMKKIITPSEIILPLSERQVQFTNSLKQNNDEKLTDNTYLIMEECAKTLSAILNVICIETDIKKMTEDFDCSDVKITENMATESKNIEHEITEVKIKNAVSKINDATTVPEKNINVKLKQNHRKITKSNSNNRTNKNNKKQLSNRQRKELAKNERKKRRDESKKENSCIQQTISDGSVLSNIKCINI